MCRSSACAVLDALHSQPAIPAHCMKSVSAPDVSETGKTHDGLGGWRVMCCRLQPSRHVPQAQVETTNTAAVFICRQAVPAWKSSCPTLSHPSRRTQCVMNPGKPSSIREEEETQRQCRCGRVLRRLAWTGSRQASQNLRSHVPWRTCAPFGSSLGR